MRIIDITLCIILCRIASALFSGVAFPYSINRNSICHGIVTKFMYILFPQTNDFFLIGKLIAMSILQGSCSFPVLHPAAYNYLVKRDYVGQVVNDEDVPDFQIRQLLQEVYIIFVVEFHYILLE